MSKLHIVSENDEPRVFELNDGITFIGRSSLNDVRILDKYVSSEHVLVRKLGDRFFVRDLGSKNGTFVNGDQIRSGIEVEVKHGASIVIGLSVMCLGETVSDEMLALVSAIRPSKKFGDTDTLVLKKSGSRPVRHKANNEASNLTLGSWHSSNI